MDPREFQTLASRLVRGKSAAEFRTAISRAYYATHHVGSELLGSMGFGVSRGPSAHKDVWNYLSNCGDPAIEEVGQQLSDLHSRRIRADYRLNNQDIETEQTALAVIEQANSMIQTLDEFRDEPKLTQVKNAIEHWREQISRLRDE